MKNKTRIVMHRFKDEDNNGNFTYEITFNKSLKHTARMNAMCSGLDRFDRHSNLWFIFHTLVSAPLSLIPLKITQKLLRFTSNKF